MMPRGAVCILLLWALPGSACTGDTPPPPPRAAAPSAIIAPAQQRAPAVSPDVSAPRGRSASVPPYVQTTLSTAQRTGAPPAGFRGGTSFHNNEGRLPASTESGALIRYREWDVHPWVRGVNRGAERLITGSDGSAWFTADHYRTFTRVVP